MFRTTVEAGLSGEEVRARREVYGDNRPTEVAKASLLHLLFRQLADLIVLILLAGKRRSGTEGRRGRCSTSQPLRTDDVVVGGSD